MRGEAEYSLQAEKLATAKLEKYTKEYLEMKTKYEMQQDEKLKFDELTKSKTEETRKLEANVQCLDVVNIHLKEEKWALASKLKTMERQLQHTTHLKTTIEDENEQLRKQLEKLTSDLSEEKKKIEEHTQMSAKFAAERLALKQKAKLFDEKLKSLNDNLELRKTASVSLEEDISKLRQELKAVAAQRDALLQEQHHYSQVDAENVKLKQDNYLLLDQLQNAQKERQNLELKLNELFEENCQLKSNYEQLRAKLSVLWDIVPDGMNENPVDPINMM